MFWVQGQPQAQKKPKKKKRRTQKNTYDTNNMGLLLLIIVIVILVSKGWMFEMKRKYRRDYYRNEYLKSGAWKYKRYIVLKRDNWRCVYCGARATQVHHKKYARKKSKRSQSIGSSQSANLAKTHNIVKPLHPESGLKQYQIQKYVLIENNFNQLLYIDSQHLRDYRSFTNVSCSF